MTSKEIRKRLKRFDKTWFNKISNTDSILDKEYTALSDEEFNACMELVRIEIDRLGVVYRSEVFDCENFASLFCALFVAIWSKDHDHILEPAVFRVIIRRQDGMIHSIVMLIKKDEIKFFEPQGYVFIDTPEVLAIA